MHSTNEYGEYRRPSKKKITTSQSNYNYDDSADGKTLFKAILLVILMVSLLYITYNLFLKKQDLVGNDVYTITRLNARLEPKNTANVKDVFEKGTRLTVIKHEHPWIKVIPIDDNLKRIIGKAWVHSSYIEKSRAVKTTEYLNARNNSNANSEILYVFHPNTVLIVLTRNNNWYLVEPSDIELKKKIPNAWVSGNYIEDM